MRGFKSGGNVVLNTCNNNDNSSSDEYPESVVLESSAEPTESVVLESSARPSMGCQFGMVWQEIQEPLTQGNHH